MAFNCDSVLKIFIFVVNSLLFLLGLAVAGIAGYIALNKKSMFHAIITGMDIPGAMTGLYILLAVGLVIAVVSILGCIGASSENRVLLWLNFFFVLLIFIMQLVAVIMCFYKYRSAQKDMREALRKISESTISGSTNNTLLSLAKSVWGLIEQEKKCCGLDGPQDYGSHIPDSCRNVSSKPYSSTITDLRDENSEEEEEVKQGEPVSSGTHELPPPPHGNETKEEVVIEHHPQSPTSSWKETVVLAAPSASPLKKQRLYSVGCIAFLKPIVYAAVGVAIGILVLELLLLSFIGWLLCEIGKDYEYLP